MASPRVARFVQSLRDRRIVDAEVIDSPSTPALAEYLDPKALAQVGQLELLSQTVVDGFLSGKHRSSHRGGCSEFAEHRPYAKGDEIRMIDWRVFAKSDRYYVKQFDDETNLQALMVVDTSGSMGFGMSTPTKLTYALMACACVSRLMLRQRDSVGLAAIHNSVRFYVPPKPRASHLQLMFEALRPLRAEGETQLDGPIAEASRRLTRRGMVILFSDCFGDIERLKSSLQLLRTRGHDVLVFQILAPEELTFTFRRPTRFEDLEHAGQRLNINPGIVRKQYLERFQRFMDELKHAVTRIGCDHEVLRTDQDLGTALAYYLRRRGAMKRK
ncbi:MAG: DUF58 domain-containing protein [Planctomycetales bacterium]|nr:DUF58 domain-containing protein [Planctomycetales bacterium]